MTIKFRSFFLTLILNTFFTSLTVSFSGDWNTFRVENTNLPSNNILCVAVDDAGIKWFGTDQGLVQFNGESWKIYSSDLYQNLTDNYINDLVVESVGNETLLWIATKNGISILDITDPELPDFGDPFTNENSPLIENDVKAVTFDPGKVGWFGTFSGLASLYDDIWGIYTTQNFWIDHNKIVSLESGPDSMVYIGTEGGGVSRLKMESVDAVSSASTLTTSWTGFDEPDKGKLMSNNIFSILVEQNGYQWFGTDSGVALHTSYNTLRDWKNFTSIDGLIDNHVQSICKENENIVWFGTPQGVSRYDGFLWTNYTSDDGLAGNNVRDIALDTDGSLWFATENGISVLTDPSTTSRHLTSEKINFLIIGNFPNPFNSQTTILFNLNTTSFVDMDIYNSKGQHIVSLVSEFKTAGRHHIIWNGSDVSGNIVPSGVYFVQVATRDQKITHKILAIK